LVLEILFMRILYILNGLGFARGMPPGGADKKALETARRLQRMGHEIGFLTTCSAGSFRTSM